MTILNHFKTWQHNRAARRRERQYVKSLKPRVIQVSPRQLALYCDTIGPDGQPLTDQLLWRRIQALLREAMRHPIQHLQPPESP